MRPLRIVLPMLRFHPDAPGGSTRVAWDEARFLTGRGHEVWAVCPAAGDRDPERIDRDGFRVLRYPAPRFRTFDPRRASAHQRGTASVLRRHLPGPPDVVHGHAPLQYDGALALASASTRTAYTVHSPAGLEVLASAGRGAVDRRLSAFVLRRVERRLLEASVVVHALSAYTRSLLLAEHGLPAARVRVIAGWVDLERFRPATDRAALRRSLGWPAGRVLFTLRRLVPRMGLDRLVRAFSRLAASDPALHLVIAGEGPMRQALESLVGSLGIGSSVRFEGRVADETLPGMYAAADAFVLPTTELECFGLIALEAFASGIPVLATPVGAIPEVVGAVEPAWLAADAGEDALAALLAAWAGGALPVHEPSGLRAHAAERYGAPARLAELAAAVLGEDP